MNKYQSHKVVEAAKIVGLAGLGTLIINAEAQSSTTIEVVHVGNEWIEKHKPQVGGYFVKYPDGYTSYSPSEAFEEGYVLVECQSQDQDQNIEQMFDEVVSDELPDAAFDEPPAAKILPNKITMAYLESLIEEETYYRVPRSTMTVCFLRLKSGFIQIGHSACADPDAFNAKSGEIFAREMALDQLWPLEGYLLCNQLNERSSP